MIRKLAENQHSSKKDTDISYFLAETNPRSSSKWEEYVRVPSKVFLIPSVYESIRVELAGWTVLDQIWATLNEFTIRAPKIFQHVYGRNIVGYSECQ